LRLRREPDGRIVCTAIALEPRPRGELLSGDLAAVRLGDIVREVSEVAAANPGSELFRALEPSGGGR
jgi:hypothetical protein